MTREEFAYELEIQPRFFSSGEFDCNDTNALNLAEKLFCIIDSLEQQNKELQARIKELEEPKTCATCKYWYEKSCSNNDGIAYNGTNAVYEDDYCKDYEQKQN